MNQIYFESISQAKFDSLPNKELLEVDYIVASAHKDRLALGGIKIYLSNGLSYKWGEKADKKRINSMDLLGMKFCKISLQWHEGDDKPKGWKLYQKEPVRKTVQNLAKLYKKRDKDKKRSTKPYHDLRDDEVIIGMYGFIDSLTDEIVSLGFIVKTKTFI